MFRPHRPGAIPPQPVVDALGPSIVAAAPVGSRVTCDPAPVDTDEDWLVQVAGNPEQAMLAAGFTQDGSPQFYTGNDAGGFRSWRLGDLNVVTTEDRCFYELFLTATALAKRFNLLDKADRIALFQAVLYGVHVDNLAHPGDYASPARIETSDRLGERMDTIDKARDQLARAKAAVAEGRWKPQQTDDDPTSAIDNLERLLALPEPAINEVGHWSDRLAEAAHSGLVFGTYPN